MGASRLLSFSAGMVLQLVPVLCRSPRRFLAVCPGVQGGLKARPVDGCPEGEPKSPSRSKPAPKRRSWSRARKPGRGLQGGATIPLLDGSRESRSLPVSRCNGDPVALSRDGLDARQRLSVRLTNPLARRSEKERVSLGIALGGARGMG